MKKILIIIDNLDIGGAQSFVLHLFKNLNRKMFSIDFFVSSDKKGFYEDFILKNNSKVFHACSPTRKPTKYKRMLKTLLKNNNYDVVHCHMNFLSYFPLSCCQKSILKICHAHASYPASNLASRIFRKFFKKWVKKHCDVLLGCSETSCQWLYGRDAKFTVVENEIDYDSFSYNEDDRKVIRESLQLNKDSFVFINVGNLEPIKRQDVLIDAFFAAFSKCPNIHLLILGDGSLRETLERKIYALNMANNIHLLGKRDNVGKYLSASDCFVFASQFEGSPISLIEAVTNGIPCVVSDSISFNEAFSKNVIKIDTRDTKKFSEELNMATHISRMSGSANQFAKDSKAISLLEKIYSSNYQS